MHPILKNSIKIFRESKRLTKKSILILSTRGAGHFVAEAKHYIDSKMLKPLGFGGNKKAKKMKDILFISGSYLDAPARYRCEFQREQMERNGASADQIFFTEVELALVKYYDVIVLFRVPVTAQIKAFILEAKKLNKMVVFDIDDIMFDESLLREKHEVIEMTEKQRKIYFDGVQRTLETMKLCEYGVASTDTIQREMQKYIPKVIVNRNSVSNKLHQISEKAYLKKCGDERFDGRLVLGYFSGSKTHNEDFGFIEEAIFEIMQKHEKVSLLIVGSLEIADKFSQFGDRIIRKQFVSWEKLPELIMDVDINLAPLVVNTFNNGKSELKFSEAALLRKPTIASDTEAFLFAIKNGETGLIAKNKKDWFEAMELLIKEGDLRKKMGLAAYKDVLERYNTKKMGENLIAFIENNRKEKILYVAPSTKISGGVMVICQHLKYLQERGYNTTFVTQDKERKITWMPNFYVPVIPYEEFVDSKLKFLDVAVATLWSTVEAIQVSGALRKIYLVQNKEHFFYSSDDLRHEQAKKTYASDIAYITISRWCQFWLKEEFGKDATYIPNAIDTETFYKTEPFKSRGRKIRILIEGNPDDDYKNVDESFRIVEKLDKNKFEIWFISYGGKPKKWYHYDEFFEKIPYRDMKRYYSSCDIFLKTSKLESFSYPPLEMMACGGVSVVAENGGNAEYIKNEINALTYSLGDIETAVKQIQRLTTDVQLRQLLIKNGQATVASRSWENTIDDLEEIYKKHI